MKSKFGFVYALLCYLLGVTGLVTMIAFLGNFIPQLSIDYSQAKLPTGLALLKNVILMSLFGVQHSVMARQSFKSQLTKIIPKHLERSTYVLASGLVTAFIVWQWAPVDGTLWQVEAATLAYYGIYALFFLGWGILFFSSFLINHFDLFGLRQAYLEMIGKPYSSMQFTILSLYKYVRHPIYLGILIGVWATPIMTVSHLIFATLMTTYIFIGIYHEEKDLVNNFGKVYQTYKQQVPKLIPWTKFSKNTSKESGRPTTAEV